jgi:5-oxoprolinase (ATP-hydrolysing)
MIGGGSGAGPNWHGTSGVHTHMTNTRITDLEILEQRYPIILKTFCLRDDNSGGHGLFKGGEGIKRELMFRKSKVTLSVLSERRVVQNYGLEGGKPGKVGLNLLKKFEDGRVINLGSKTMIDVNAGDVFSMLTPGGGGWGKKVEKRRRSEEDEADEDSAKTFYEKGSLFAYRMLQESV